MRELERRESAKIAARDLKMAQEDRLTNAATAERDRKMANRSHNMEVAVIVLIGLEIVIAVAGLWYGIHEGNKQQRVLEQMGKNTNDTAHILSDQRKTLGDMNNNTHDTVEAVGKLQKVQDDSLGAQKNTLRSVGKMNESLQHQLDLAFAVAVTVSVDEASKRIVITNLTKTSIYIWGAKFGDESPIKFSDERFIAPGTGYFFQWVNIFNDARVLTPKGGASRQMALDFYLIGADGKRWIARGYILETWEGDTLKVYPTLKSVKQEEWPTNVQNVQ